jgi:hypothetical protein
MVDPQRNIVDDGKFPKSLGQATQINRRQSNLSLSRIVGGILFIVGST